MKKIIIYTMTSVMLLSANLSNAADEEGCKKPRTPYDRAYCLAKDFVASDEELNTAYGTLFGSLNGVQRKQLQSSQRHWLAYRDSQCLKNNQIDTWCNYQLNITRADFLRTSYRQTDNNYSCYWMENYSGRYKWVPFPSIRSKQECNNADACSRGGACYKWAASASEQGVL